jgi:hypothetical protein
LSLKLAIIFYISDLRLISDFSTTPVTTAKGVDRMLVFHIANAVKTVTCLLTTGQRNERMICPERFNKKFQ